MIKFERGINTKPANSICEAKAETHPLRPMSNVFCISSNMSLETSLWQHRSQKCSEIGVVIRGFKTAWWCSENIFRLSWSWSEQILLIIISTLFQSCLFLTSMPWCAYCFIQHCLTLPLIQLWLCLNWQICSLGLCFLLHLCCWLWSVSCHIALHLGQACSIPTQSCLCVCVFACVFNHVGRVCLSVAACNPAWSYRHVSFWQILPENSPHPGKNPVGQFPTDIFSGSIPSPGKFPRKSPEWRVTAHTIVVILLCCSHLLAS